MENLRARSDQYETNDEVVRYNERYEEHIRTSDRTVPVARERVSEKKKIEKSLCENIDRLVNDETDLINKHIR